ncbi:MAG: hypothetical protein IKS46_02340 [Clostridia bacterium]|nr:hypothetical protein [Clostridia bacterium]
MKRAEDFREAFGPVDSGFNMVVNKTIEELKTNEQKRRPLAAIYPIRFRPAAAAAALVVLIGAGILGLTGRKNGMDPADKIQDEIQYIPLSIEMALTQGNEQDTGSAGTEKEEPQVHSEVFDPEKDVIRIPGETLSYECMLQDGRLLLTGTALEDGPDIEYTIWKARLVCLNPDGTVSWEYTGPEEKIDGSLWFYYAAVLKDGTIAVRHAVYPRYESGIVTIQFFTPDGERIDKATDAFEGNDCVPHPSFLMKENSNEEGISTGTEVIDWDGNVLTRFFDDRIFGEGWRVWMQGDELVVFGSVGTEKPHAKIVKMDGLTDKVLWENVLDYQWPDTDCNASLDSVVKTKDGGYAAILWECKYGAADGEDIARHAVVKFDANGKVQWINKADYQGNDIECKLGTHNGKIVLIRNAQGEAGVPWTAQWFDEEGNSLGTTELEIKPEYFAVLSRMTEPENAKRPRLVSIDRYDLISRTDGLWAMVSASLNDYYRSENELVHVNGSDDMIMIRIPEPSAHADPAESGDDAGKDSFLARDEEIVRARETIAEAYPDLDLLNTAEYGFEGNVYEWGTEVRFLTRNTSHGDVQAAVLTDGTILLDYADREQAGDVNTLFRRYQSAYGRISRWNRETWAQLAKDIESMNLNDKDPDPVEGTLLRLARFPEESTVRIGREEAEALAWEKFHGETEFQVLIDSEAHPVWKCLLNTWPVNRLIELDAETGEVVASEACITSHTPAYALFSTEKNRRALELKELGTEAIAKREALYAFAELNLDLPEPDLNDSNEYDILVNGRYARFTGRWNGLKTFEVELDENGYVLRCKVTDTLSGGDRQAELQPEGSEGTAEKHETDLPETSVSSPSEMEYERIADKLVPVDIGRRNQGIRLVLISAYAEGNSEWFVCSLQDLESERISGMNYPVFLDQDLGTVAAETMCTMDYNASEQKWTCFYRIDYKEPIDFSDRPVTLSVQQLEWTGDDENDSTLNGSWAIQFPLSAIRGNTGDGENR